MADAGSAQNSADSGHGKEPATKRRRTSTNPSSRGVANLTPEQLARKRANDREAQRAIRERTKNQIDRLNSRIRELESQQPYYELQQVLRQKEAIQAENEDIRKRLSSVLALIQPILGASQGLNELAAAAERSPLPLPSATDPQIDQQQLAPPVHHQDPRNFHHGSIPHATDPPVDHGAVNTPSPGSASSSRHWSFPGVPPTSHVRGGWPQNNPPFDQPPSNIHPDLGGYNHSDERLGVEFLLEGPERVAKMSNGAPPHGDVRSPGAPISQNGQPLEAHSTLPRFLGPTCPLDSLLMDFLTERHAQAAEGVPMKQLVGPLYPNFSSLLYPDKNIPAHPLSKVFTDILRTFPDICALPEQVAVVFIMFLVMRWAIEPSQENYDRLPEWVTPRPSQLFTPHPPWMDHLPWPRLRDRMVQAQPHQVFETFFIPYTTTISVNWPYDSKDCLLPAPAPPQQPVNHSTPSSQLSAPSPFSTVAQAGSPTAPAVSPVATSGATGAANHASSTSNSGQVDGPEQQWLINPAFESHLRDLRNWTLGPAFRTAFPHLADCVNIKEGGR